VSYYAGARDLTELPGGELVLYREWDVGRASQAINAADVAMVTSYCPDAQTATRLIADGQVGLRCFYDLDTPVTLAQVAAGNDVAYLPEGGLADFDLVLSFTGGRALDLLRAQLCARHVVPLYGSVDPEQHRPVPPDPAWAAACSYLGTWSDDRHAMLDALFLEAARRRPHERFVLAGAQYPAHVEFPPNVVRHEHVPPPDHPAFYCSSPVTVSVTRAPMAELGYCPSGRLFEAAACGVPVLSDRWEGIETFFVPGEEILLASTTEEADAALQLPRDQLARIALRARERALDEHSGSKRAAELVAAIEGAI